METKLELINTNLRRYTFENKRMKKWVEENSFGKVLNLFAGYNRLNLNEFRVDIDENAIADTYMDALDFVDGYTGTKFDTVILDPPYSYRKSMEMYNGNYTSKFKRLADELSKIMNLYHKIISFGYHSTFMGKTRGYVLEKLCVFAHGGAQHCTIGIVEVPNGKTEE